MFNRLMTPLSRHAALCAALALPWAAQGQATPGDDADDLEALLNQPVYAASKFTQDAAGAPAAVTVLTAGDIRAYGWRSLAEVLNGVRGVYLRYDRFYNYIGVRGFSRPGDFSSRLLVLVDGMRVNDNIYDQAGVGSEFPLDIGLIERVEFIPGPGSALYGSNAVLGVVNIVTRSAASLAGGNVALELGSAGGRTLSLTQSREFGDARLVLAARIENRAGPDLYFSEYDTPMTNGGVSADADRQTDRKLYAKWKDGDLTVAALLSRRLKGIPTGAFGTVFPSTETRAVDSYGFADLRWQHEVEAGSEVFVRATLGQYLFNGRFDYGSVDGVQHLDQQGRWLGVEARWQRDVPNGQRLVLGVEAQRNLEQRQRSRYVGAVGGEGLVDLDATSQRWGFFVQDELTLRPGLRTVLGARLDRQLSGEQTATPRLALLWDAAPGLVLKWLDGRAYREPNAYESQYSDNATQPDRAALRSESLRASELALDWRVLPNLRLAASLYRYKVDDLIEQVPLDNNPNALIYDNVGSVDAKGLELEADYVGASGWRLRGSWAGQRARNVDGDEQLGNSPSSLTKLNLSLPLPAWQARLGVEWQRIGRRLTVGRATLPAHALTNLSLQFVPPGVRLTWSAAVYNLFDKAYADPAGPEHVQDTLAQDGRQWRLQMAWQY